MLLSHGHEDHVADAVSICKQSNCTAAGAWEVMAWLQKNGVENTHGMNTGGSWQFDFGTVKLVQAVHSSSMPDGSYGGNPVGFVISNAEDTFYYAGDTALYSDMKLISDRFQLKTAFLPIGSNFTMDVHDALQAAKLLQCNKIIGMHFDTFGFIKIDHNEAIQLFAKHGIELILMGIGETINL